jgi:YbgC/YbaW family acyl-CoA thioester hydrolase
MTRDHSAHHYFPMPSAEAGFSSISGRFACEVYWGDCDPAGIIFYPTYFRWFDAATWAFFASVGYTAKRMRAEARSMPLVAANCQFMHPAEQADRCEVRSRIERFGGKSFVVAHEAVRVDGAILARGTETRVWGRHVGGPGSPMKGETIAEDIKSLFRIH